MIIDNEQPESYAASLDLFVLGDPRSHSAVTPVSSVLYRHDDVILLDVCQYVLLLRLPCNAKTLKGMHAAVAAAAA
jgi:hypothetical protein